MGRKTMQQQMEAKRLLKAILGTFIFAAGVNLFIVPAGLYSGGFLGIGQIIRTLLSRFLGLDFGNIDIAGIILYVINIPLMVLAYKKMGKAFFIKTIICVTTQTLFLTIIPVNLVLIKGELLTSTIVGGALSGYGGGLMLSAGASGGGQDIIGIYMMKEHRNFSVGKIALLINCVVYLGCIMLYDVSVVIYSLIYVTICSFVTDRVHLQNVNMSVIVITDELKLVNDIIRSYKRSATIIKGTGGYSQKECYVIYSVLSKYEARALKENIRKVDAHAFASFAEIRDVEGNYERHL